MRRFGLSSEGPAAGTTQCDVNCRRWMLRWEKLADHEPVARSIADSKERTTLLPNAACP